MVCLYDEWRPTKVRGGVLVSVIPAGARPEVNWPARTQGMSARVRGMDNWTNQLPEKGTLIESELPDPLLF